MNDRNAVPARFLEKVLESFPELREGRTLLAVSGGIDSIFMTHLFRSAGWSFGIAHCNFQLRGAASDGDQGFLEALAQDLNVPFHHITFDTTTEAATRNISIQMAARELRYPWLEQVREENGYDFVATAHHLNDSIETSLINQSRGTGLRGLSGISARQGHLIRPLIHFTRKELEAVITEQHLAYREDSSNAKDEYYRNRIRHHVIPVLQSINPSFEATFEKNMSIWSESAYLMEWACTQIGREYLNRQEGRMLISYDFLEDHAPAALSLLFEWLRAYGFHIDQLRQALESVGKLPGAVWYAPAHRLLADRSAFILEARDNKATDRQVFVLERPGQTVVLDGGSLGSILEERTEPPAFSRSEWSAQLDAARVSFPLTIRHWREGDAFCPLGMEGRHKKVKDFFTDRKINRFDKENIWLVLASNADIIWIIGHRIDDRYKLRPQSRKVLKLSFVPD